jgi:hypothetical protein
MQRSKNKVLIFLLSLACFIAGVAAALGLVYHFISQDSKPADINKAKKDTMFVKLVDPLYLNTSTAAAKTETNDAASGPVKITKPLQATAQTKDIKLPAQQGRTLAKNNPAPIAMAQLEKDASALSRQSSLKKIFSPAVWLYLFTALLIILAAFFSKKEKLVNAQLVDKDPPILKKLFDDFGPEIGRFRNPRKILRFMNLVKYHYYFLDKNNSVTDANLVKLMWILLEIQKDPALMNVENITADKLNGPGWFYERIQGKEWFSKSGIKPEDDELMMIILKLNIDMGA